MPDRHCKMSFFAVISEHSQTAYSKAVMSKQLEYILDTSAGAVRDLGVARALLDEVRDGTRGPTLRIYQPQPTVAFGARDRFAPGFPGAIKAARTHGFTPALRTLGGRAAAYHLGSLVIDHLEPSDTLYGETQERFTQFGELYVAALRSLGVDARMGEIPGEYCPGEHSINAAGHIKIIGTAQRVTNRGWLFSSSVIVTDPDPIRACLTSVEEALGVEWNPQTGGALSELHPGITVDQVKDAVLDAYASHWDLREGHVTDAVVQASHAYDERHRLD